MNQLDRIHLVNKFFNNEVMEGEVLKNLQTEYQKELTIAKNQKGGCSTCKLNAIRRKFKQKILEIQE